MTMTSGVVLAMETWLLSAWRDLLAVVAEANNLTRCTPSLASEQLEEKRSPVLQGGRSGEVLRHALVSGTRKP